MFLHALVIFWFSTIGTVEVAAVTPTEVGVFGETESAALPKTSISSGQLQPSSTLDTTSNTSTDTLKAPEDSFTLATVSGPNSMETGLSNGYSPTVLPASPRNGSDSYVTASEQAPVSIVTNTPTFFITPESDLTTQEHFSTEEQSGSPVNELTPSPPTSVLDTVFSAPVLHPTLSPASTEDDFITPVTTSDHVNTEISAHLPTNLSVSADNDSVPYSVFATTIMEKDTSAHNLIASPTFSVNDLTTSMTASIQVTMESLTPVHNPAFASTSPEGDSANLVSTAMINSRTPAALCPHTSPENNLVTTVTMSDHLTIEKVLTSDHKPHPTPTSLEGDSAIPGTNYYVSVEINPTYTVVASPTIQEKGSNVPTNAPSQVATQPVNPTELNNSSTFVYATVNITVENSAYVPVASSGHAQPTNPISTEVIPTSTHTPTESAVSSEYNSTKSVATSVQDSMATISIPVHTVMASLPSQRNDYTVSVSTSDQISMETVTNPVHSPVTASSSPAGNSTTPSTPPDHVTTTAYTPSLLPTSFENDSMTLESTLSESSIETSGYSTVVPSPSPKNDYSTPLATLGSVTMETTAYISTAPPVFSDGTPINEPVTTFASNHLSSASSPENEFTGSVFASDGTTKTVTDAPQSPIYPAHTSPPEEHVPTFTSVRSNVTVEPEEAISKHPPVSFSTSPSSSVDVDANTTVSKFTTVPHSSSAASTWATEGTSNSTATTGNITADTVQSAGVTSGLSGQSSTPPPEASTNVTTRPLTTGRPVRPPGGFCSPVTCPFNSVCLDLNVSFLCQCLAGTFFSMGHCVQAKVFPGALRMRSMTFTPEMADMSSRMFQEMAANVSEALKEALKDYPGYIKSTVLELTAGSVVASVNNIFTLSSNVTRQATSGAIAASIQDCGANCGLLARADFSATNLCSQQPPPCDVMTTSCVFRDNGTAVCICKEGFIPSLYSNTTCAACPSGETAVNGVCVPCPFGYAGFNCNDSALLAVVVVSCVLGNLLLILLLAFIIYCWRRPLASSAYANPGSPEDFHSMWPNKEIAHIPRANNDWDPAQMEMTESSNADSDPEGKWHRNGVTGSYEAIHESMKTFKGKNSSQYSYLVQGHENPYFLSEDTRKAS